MNPAKKRVTAANVFGITGVWDNFQPVFFLRMQRKPMTAPSKSLLKPIKKEDGGGNILWWGIDKFVLPLVKQGCIYGQYYHVKKEKEKRPGNKAMTIVMRNFLKKFYGWYQSGKAFDQKRFFDSKSLCLKAA
jgi:hypothetical protein